MRLSVADDLIHALVQSVMNKASLDASAWESYTLVAIQTDSQRSAYGLYFDADGNYYPATPKGVDLHERLEELRVVMKKPGEPTWVSCLIQVARATDQITTQFEYTNPDRWRVTPENLTQMIEAIRPPAAD
jgi:hypothetical protein